MQVSGIYALLVISYAIAFRYLFLFLSGAVKSKKDYNYKPSISVVVPIFNENEERLNNCVQSLLNQNYVDYSVYLVNDGGNNDLQRFEKYEGLTVLNHDSNKGKREALYTAIEEAKGEIIVTVDSDTIVDSEALKHIGAYFVDKNVGALTGNIRVENDKSFLTKMIDIRYWLSNNFERKYQGAYGGIICNSGVLSAYRKEILIRLKDEYLNQTFLGQRCTYGDDRHFTTLFLKYGHKVKYCKEAKARTYVPETVKDYYTQQCLPYYENIYIKENGKFKKINIGKLFKNFEGYGWDTPKKDTYVLSFNKDLKSEFKKIKGLYKRRGDRKILKITLQNGKKIYVSKDHPLLVPTKTGFSKKKAENLTDNDYLPTPKKMNIVSQKQFIELDFSNFSEKTIDGLNKNIKIDNDLAKLIGYWIAEGCIDSQSIRFAFSYFDEKHIAEEVKKLINNIFGKRLNPKVHKQSSCWMVRCYSVVFLSIFEQLGLKHGANHKNIPDFVFEQNTEFISKVIESYFIGDGHIRKRNNNIEITANTVSRELAYDLSLLLNKISIANTVRKTTEKTRLHKNQDYYNRYFISISGGRNLRRFIKLMPNLAKERDIKIDNGDFEYVNNYGLIPTKIIDKDKWNVEVSR